MNLVLRHNGLGIEGIPYAVLEKILNDNSPITVQNANRGIILLSNHRIIKCVKHYYSIPGQPFKNKKVSNECYYVQSYFGLRDSVPNFACVRCHQQCLQLKNAGQIVANKY